MPPCVSQLGSIGALVWGLGHPDHLPVWLRRRIYAVVGAHDGQEAVQLSRLLAYRIDAWFSNNAYAKILSLLYLTLALIYIGCLGLYAVSGTSLHDAFWQVRWPLAVLFNPCPHLCICC